MFLILTSIFIKLLNLLRFLSNFFTYKTVNTKKIFSQIWHSYFFFYFYCFLMNVMTSDVTTVEKRWKKKNKWKIKSQRIKNQQHKERISINMSNHCTQTERSAFLKRSLKYYFPWNTRRMDRFNYKSRIQYWTKQCVIHQNFSKMHLQRVRKCLIRNNKTTTK